MNDLVDDINGVPKQHTELVSTEICLSLAEDTVVVTGFEEYGLTTQSSKTRNNLGSMYLHYISSYPIMPRSIAAKSNIESRTSNHINEITTIDDYIAGNGPSVPVNYCPANITPTSMEIRYDMTQLPSVENEEPLIYEDLGSCYYMPCEYFESIKLELSRRITEIAEGCNCLAHMLRGAVIESEECVDGTGFSKFTYNPFRLQFLGIAYRNKNKAEHRQNRSLVDAEAKEYVFIPGISTVLLLNKDIQQYDN